MHFNRPGIDKIYDAVESGAVDAILVKDLSRIGRHRTQTVLFIDYLREHHVRVLSVTENIDTSDENDDLIVGFKGLVNDFYARTNKDAVTIAHANYAVTKANGTLTIVTKPSSGSGDSSSGAVAPTPVISGSTATTTATTRISSKGTVTASVTQAQVSSAITWAQKAAISTGKAPCVEIQASDTDAGAVQTTLPKPAVKVLVTGGMESLTLNTPSATMGFDSQAIAAIAGAASGDVTISTAQVKNSTLPEAAAKVVGDRPVITSVLPPAEARFPSLAEPSRFLCPIPWRRSRVSMPSWHIILTPPVSRN